jgi:hypothetical protein
MNFIKISWRNSCDFAGFLYKYGYQNEVYFDTDLGVPEYQRDEEGVENGDGEFIPTFQKLKKIYQLETGKVPEFFLDALQLMPLHDEVYITTKEEETAQMKDITVEIKDRVSSCFVNCLITFTVDYFLKTNCCNDLDCDCPEANLDNVIDSILTTDPIYTDPADNGVKEGDRYLVLNSSGEGDIYVADAELNWQAQGSDIEGNIVYDGSYNWYYTGAEWKQLCYLNEYSLNGTEVTLGAYAVPGTFVKVYSRVQGDTVWTLRATMTAEEFNELPVIDVIDYGNIEIYFVNYQHGCTVCASNILTISIFLFASLHLDSVDVKKLYDTPQEIIPAQGDGKAIVVFNAFFEISNMTTAYTTNKNLHIYCDTTTVFQITEARSLESTINRIIPAVVEVGAIATNKVVLVENQPLMIGGVSGNPSGGDGDLDIYIWYYLTTS